MYTGICLLSDCPKRFLITLAALLERKQDIGHERDIAFIGFSKVVLGVVVFERSVELDLESVVREYPVWVGQGGLHFCAILTNMCSGSGAAGDHDVGVADGLDDVSSFFCAHGGRPWEFGPGWAVALIVEAA